MTVRTDPFAEPIDTRPNFKDPAVLLTYIDLFVEGLAVQSQAAASESAMQGHPHPRHLFAQAAEVLAAARPYVEAKVPKPEPKDEKKPEPVKKAG